MSKRNWRMSDNSIDDSLDVILISLKGKKKKKAKNAYNPKSTGNQENKGDRVWA